MTVNPRPALAAVRPYHPGKPIEEVQRELGLARVIKLASNENPLGPSPAAIAALREATGELWLYPEATSYRLRQALAAHLDLPADHIIVGNGSDEILLLLMRAYVDAGDEVVIPAPTFPMYEIGARVAGATVVEVPLRDWTIDLDAVAAAMTPRTRLVALCLPNNPTGTSVPAAALERFLAAVRPGVLIVLDQAYHEYVQNPSHPDGVEHVRAGRDVLVLRTFSKIYGLAGLRVGYGIARPEILTPLWTVREPFSVNLAAQEAARAALGDSRHVQVSRESNERGKRQLYRGFDRLGVRYVPTDANFILADTGRPAAEVFDGLLRRGIIVRALAGQGLTTHVRVTIGTEEQNEAFLAALAHVLGRA